MTYAQKGSVASRLLASVAATVLVAGCVTTAEREQAVTPQVAHAYLDGKPDALRDHFFVNLSQGNRNRVLNDMRLGLASIEMGRYELAEELFDDALTRIEAIYANNEQAAKARQLFVKELVKDFKGEPYERTMAYFYRGILYLKAGDYENARASFKGGLLQDAFADEDQNRADFALMPYLQGWAAHCAGNASLADEDFKEFRENNQVAPLPADKDNVLILVETGLPPTKYSDTDKDATKPRYLKFNRGSYGTGAQEARVTFADGTAKTALLEDVYRQASTRGGRPFDSILAGKAQFKDAADTVGNVAAVGAGVAATVALQSGDRDAAIAAGILLAIALASKAAAEATEPNADVRYWDNLPDKVHGVTLNLPAGTASVSVEFLRDNGESVAVKDVPIWRAGRCGLGWVREQPARPAHPRAPSSAPKEQMYQAVVIPPLPAEPAPGQPAQAVAEQSKPANPFSNLFGSRPAAAAEAPKEAAVETSSGAAPAQAPAEQGGGLDKLKTGFMRLFQQQPETTKPE